MQRLELDFTDQTVLITGATRGIGQQLAKDFTGLGAQVICTGTKSGEGILGLDFSDEKSVDSFFQKINDKRIDVLVNNAAWNRNNLIGKASPDDWDKVIGVDLKGPWLLIRKFGPMMKENGYGRIVNIASILGIISIVGRSAYSSAKSGLIGMTKAAALDLAPEVLVNSVSPGFVDTQLTRTKLTLSEIDKITERIPLKRLALTSDISTAVIFLASRLNTYICGQNLVVDGGYTNA